MIWLLGFSLISSFILMFLLYRFVFKEFHKFWLALHELSKSFPQPTECRFKEQECQFNAINDSCRYSPGSEPERICALREADKKYAEKTFIREAPQWIESSGSSDEK